MATTITPESLTSKEADWKQRFEREMLSGIEGISLQVRITSCTHLGGTHEVHRPWQQHERVSDVVPGITAVYVVLIQKEALVSASPADVRHWAESAVATINDYDVAGEPLQEALGQCPVFF